MLIYYFTYSYLLLFLIIKDVSVSFECSLINFIKIEFWKQSPSFANATCFDILLCKQIHTFSKIGLIVQILFGAVVCAWFI